jgi:hypothetical protein
LAANAQSDVEQDGLTGAPAERGAEMLDLLMAAFTGLFFIVALAYIKGCEHLR